MTESSQTKLAVLLHCHHWAGDPPVEELSPGIRLSKTANTDVERAYYRACLNDNLDNREPYIFGAHIEIDSKTDTLDWDDPYSVVDRLCNVIVINTRYPLGFCRLLWSSDGFQTIAKTQDLYTYTQVVDFLDESQKALGLQLRKDISHCWRRASTIWSQEKAISRIQTVLTYFYYAWRSHYVDQAMINLAVVIEHLFAPGSFGELSHQIAVNTARFLHPEEPDMRKTYSIVKKFYAVRSALVHGGMPSEDKIIEQIDIAFPLCAQILQKLLLSDELSSVFNNESKRKELLGSYIFGTT